MTSSSGTSSTRWLLEATCYAAHCDSLAWEQQLQLLRSIAHFSPSQKVWTVRIGTLDVAALRTLQTLFDAAERFGTAVQLEAVVAPAPWQGPVFDDDGELAGLVTARADRDRKLGQLPGI